MTDIDQFITKWKASGGAEMANSQSFLGELCDLLDVPRPDPTHAAEDDNTYVFEKHVKLPNGDGTYGDGRIDLYRKGAFVLESKQGSERKDEEEQLACPEKKRKKRQGNGGSGNSQLGLGDGNISFRLFGKEA